MNPRRPEFINCLCGKQSKQGTPTIIAPLQWDTYVCDCGIEISVHMENSWRMKKMEVGIIRSCNFDGHELGVDIIDENLNIIYKIPSKFEKDILLPDYDFAPLKRYLLLQ